MVRFIVPVLVVCLSAQIAAPAYAGDKPLPADLAFVPPDAAGFIHVRLADVWKSEFVKPLRQTVMAAGDKLLAAFDERFFPRPSSLERLTIVVTLPKAPEPKERNANERQPGGRAEFVPAPIVVIIATSKAIDREAFLKHTLSGAELEKTPQGTFIVHARKGMEVYFVNDRTLAVGAPGAVRELVARPRAAKGNLTDALRLAQAGKPVVMALNAAALPPREFKQIPPALQPLLKAKLATLTLDLQERLQIDVRATYANGEQAAEAETAAKEGLKMARAFLAKAREEMEKKVRGSGKPGTLDELPEAAVGLLAVGLLNQVDDYLTSVPLRKEGNELHVSLKLPTGVQSLLAAGAVGAALLVPSVQKVREAASRTQSANNLKQIALAMHNYHDAHGKLPSAAICDKGGKPLLSWRVAILPYIEQDGLRLEFRMDEPWDSEHNRKLIPRMPSVYSLPAVPPKPGQTYYRVFVGGGAGFDWDKGMRFQDILDGTSNTIMAVEAAESVPWTKPDELVYDAKKPLPKLGDFYGNGMFNAAFFDGSVRALRNNLPERTLRAYITRAGGEPGPNDD